VLVHGSAADHTTWSIQLASRLGERFELVAVDRRLDATTVAEHAADVATAIDDQALLVGSSFGSVVVLELARTWPARCSGMVLIEPPMGATDDPASGAQAPATFLDEFDRRVAAEGGPAAGELFLRTVLGDATFERMPRAYQERAKAKWAEIRADSAALIAYRPRYRELASLTVPTVLVGGERSALYFRHTLDALAAVLPAARREVVAGAGHMLHAEAPRRFAEILVEFADRLGIG
jgi:pimeloyl-ACP methyl ester carboxylesterase